MLIRSRENPLVKEACALIRDKKLRSETGLFVAEGARLCSEAARSGAEVLRLFLTEKAEKCFPEYVSPLIASAREVCYITPSVAEKLSDTVSPQGVFALCRLGEREIDLEGDGLFVLLSELRDPGNLGTVLRTCEAMDVKGVFLCRCAELLSPKVLRSSMGCLFRLPVKELEQDAEAVLSMLKTAGVTTYAAALSEHATPLPKVSFERRSCVVIGNEGHGLSPAAVGACDEAVIIPMPGRAESLNAACAAAIMLYAASQRRG